MKYTKQIATFVKTACKKKKVIVIYGPTACGKTGLWVQIAKLLKTEVISTDSRQIYIWMDIGTGKVTKKEMKKIPHHMIDIATPDEQFSVGRYKKEALKVMKRLWSEWKIPVLVGGTWLYIDALIFDFQAPKCPEDLTLRKKYEIMAQKHGKQRVYEELEKIDPEYAKTLHANNLQYVIRGIEVKKITWKSKLDFKKEKKLKYDTFFLTPYEDEERTSLYKKIDTRVQGMFENWLLKEVTKLVKKYGADAPWLEAIGYTEVIDFLDGKIDEEECLAKVQQNSRNYAKRQVTWFRKYTQFFS